MKKGKIIITGGSGFIGTNLLEFYFRNGFEVFNLDLKPPRNTQHISAWNEVDICDFDALKKIFQELNADYVVHLAAKTDLNENEGLEYYKANILGVENIIKLCNINSNIKRVIFASSMLVNRVGYLPSNYLDYNPSTLYGSSKVLGENLVFENENNLAEFCIIRPTSIWGEWFSEPYKNFFDFVLSNRFFKPGNRSCTKTYGYVGNSIFQINKLLFAESTLIKSKVFYIGDTPPINIAIWADEIAEIANISKPKEIPFIIFNLAGLFGDILSYLRITFPMTSFRVKNMTTDYIVNLDSTYDVCGSPPFNRIQGIERTLNWMKNEKI